MLPYFAPSLEVLCTIVSLMLPISHFYCPLALGGMRERGSGNIRRLLGHILRVLPSDEGHILRVLPSDEPSMAHLYLPPLAGWHSSDLVRQCSLLPLAGEMNHLPCRAFSHKT